MAIMSGNQAFAKDLCEALGLPPNVRCFELRVAVDEAVTVTAEFYPELPKGRRGALATIVRKYDLVERPRDVTAIGDKAVTMQVG